MRSSGAWRSTSATARSSCTIRGAWRLSSSSAAWISNGRFVVSSAVSRNVSPFSTTGLTSPLPSQFSDSERAKWLAERQTSEASL